MTKSAQDNFVKFIYQHQHHSKTKTIVIKLENYTDKMYII